MDDDLNPSTPFDGVNLFEGLSESMEKMSAAFQALGESMAKALMKKTITGVGLTNLDALSNLMELFSSSVSEYGDYRVDLEEAVLTVSNTPINEGGDKEPYYEAALRFTPQPLEPRVRQVFWASIALSPEKAKKRAETALAGAWEDARKVTSTLFPFPYATHHLAIATGFVIVLEDDE